MTQTVLLGDILEISKDSLNPAKSPDTLYDVYSIPGYDKGEPEKLRGCEIKSNKFVVKPNSILVSKLNPRIPRVWKVNKVTDDSISSTEFVVLSVKQGYENLLDYLYAVMSSDAFSAFLQSRVKGTSGSHQRIKPEDIYDYEVVIDSSQAEKTGAFIKSIDEKIELNRQMNQTLEQMGQSLFRHYFVDNPEAEEREKRELGEFFPIKTGKKDANFGTDDGEYPFFTCAQTISKAPDFSFDAHAILIAGNGDFNIKLYRGKFEAYQRTYVLIPNDERLVGLLYFLMKIKLSEITGGSRGSVIKFITKGMIENYKFVLPDDDKLVEMAEVFNQLTINIEENNKQIQTLTTLRDTLLPRLISGEVEV